MARLDPALAMTDGERAVLRAQLVRLHREAHDAEFWRLADWASYRYDELDALEVAEAAYLAAVEADGGPV